ncbi:hypothetical protein D3C84_1125390 [compost metagenome]
MPDFRLIRMQEMLISAPEEARASCIITVQASISDCLQLASLGAGHCKAMRNPVIRFSKRSNG